MVIARWEVGSFFEWSEGLVGGDSSEDWFPRDHVLFSNGRGALLSLIRGLGVRQRGRALHLPSYYDMTTAATLKSEVPLVWYRELATEPNPNFDTLRPTAGDFVLAQNFFGIRDGRAWRDWHRRHNGVILIEDHTHDPFSAWARHSTAHYAMATLRKTLPTPDGGILWSPQGLPLPTPASLPPIAAYERLAAMVLRAAYLKGADISKDAYRTLGWRGEEGLHAEHDSAASDFTRIILYRLDIPGMRCRREANVRTLVRLLSLNTRDDWQSLFSSWPEGTVPFNGALVCRSASVRRDLQRFLSDRAIHCPIHWPQQPNVITSTDQLAIDLSERLLTIPTDYRYTSEDVTRVVDNLAEFARRRGAAVNSC